MTLRTIFAAAVMALSMAATAPSASATSVGDRDLAIATLLYAQVAGEACTGVSLDQPVRSVFMQENGLAEPDLSPKSAQWGEIVEALTELSALFRAENEGACNTAWLLLGNSGYMASGMLVKPELQKRAAR